MFRQSQKKPVKLSAEEVEARAKPIREAANTHQKELLAEYEAEDLAEREAAKNFSPQIIQQYHAEVWLGYGKVEVPARYIESITVSYAGAAPRAGFSFRGTDYGVGDDELRVRLRSQPDMLAQRARLAQIEIRMLAGSVHYIECNRWEADALLAAWLTAWKVHR